MLDHKDQLDHKEDKDLLELLDLKDNLDLKVNKDHPDHLDLLDLPLSFTLKLYLPWESLLCVPTVFKLSVVVVLALKVKPSLDLSLSTIMLTEDGKSNAISPTITMDLLMMMTVKFTLSACTQPIVLLLLVATRYSFVRYSM